MTRSSPCTIEEIDRSGGASQSIGWGDHGPVLCRILQARGTTRLDESPDSVGYRQARCWQLPKRSVPDWVTRALI